jgi:Uma2 family endonuclease
METIVLKDSVTNRMTDEEFFSFCQENQDLKIERNNNLEIIIMSPVSTLSGLHSSEILSQLSAWSKKDGRGIVFDASAGFTLPDRSVLSPDASWLSLIRWNKLSDDNKDKFAPVCPEFVIEVRSKTDDLETLRKKMKVWIKNGAQLAWLIDPRDKISFVYKGDVEEKFEGFDRKISGDGPVKGFELDLSQIQLH